MKFTQRDYRQLLNSLERKSFEINCKKRLRQDRVVIFSGTFNPWHWGHQKIYDYAERYFDIKPILETSIQNSKKGPQSFEQIQENIIPLFIKNGGVITNCHLYEDKIELLRNNNEVIFVCGADHWNSTIEKLRDLESFKKKILENPIYFFVFPRNGIELKERELFSNSLFVFPISEFKISSTEIRDRQ